MFSRRMLTISAMLLVVSGYLYFFQHLQFFIWPACVFLLLLMCAYVFQHQLNWWWYNRFPPELPPEMHALYVRSSGFYAGLSQSERRKFDVRARLFVEAREFIGQGIKEVPEDVKYMVAYYAVLLTYYRDQFLFDPYNRVVVYLHPFLTPNHPDHVHTYELEHEDGTIIFSLEQLLAGYVTPEKYYQTGLHAFAELLIRESHSEGIGQYEHDWALVERSGNWSRSQVDEFTGLLQTDARPSLIHNFILNRDKMWSEDPGCYRALADFLRWPELPR